MGRHGSLVYIRALTCEQTLGSFEVFLIKLLQLEFSIVSRLLDVLVRPASVYCSGVRNRIANHLAAYNGPMRFSCPASNTKQYGHPEFIYLSIYLYIYNCIFMHRKINIYLFYSVLMEKQSFRK